MFKKNIELINVVTNEVLKICDSELIVSKHKTNECIFSISHGGLFVPVCIERKFSIGQSMLMCSDMFTQELYSFDFGFSVASNLNIFVVNMNRYREGGSGGYSKHMDQDPLHTLSVTDEEVLLEDLSSDEKESLLRVYDEYHEKLKIVISEMQEKKGYALMFDCHSTNSIGLKNSPVPGEKKADIIISTVDDSSADKRIIDVFFETMKTEASKYGWIVAKNDPYQGGAITRIYGKPHQGVHVIQIEVVRKIYMNEILDKNSDEEFYIKKEGLEKLNKVLSFAIKCVVKEAELILK